MHSDVLELWTLIPNSLKLKPKPNPVLPNEAPSSHVVLGLNPRTPNTITNASFPLKRTLQALATFIGHWAPKFQYTTIVLQANGNKGPHRDLNNFEGFSFLTCLTTQQGGDLWIQDPKGTQAMMHHGNRILGTVWRTQHQPVLLQSRSFLHCCPPWKTPLRTTLIAFNPLHARTCAPALQLCLRQNWSIPAPNPGDMCRWAARLQNQETLEALWGRETDHSPRAPEKPA